jgi:hypothetical protein
MGEMYEVVVAERDAAREMAMRLEECIARLLSPSAIDAAIMALVYGGVKVDLPSDEIRLLLRDAIREAMDAAGIVLPL